MFSVAGTEAWVRPRNRVASMGPKIGRPMLKQPISDWRTIDKYTALQNFRLMVNKIFKTCNRNDTETGYLF